MKKTCCICGEEFDGYGNNAWPVCDGECCDDCNRDEVIPARLAQAIAHDQALKGE